MDSVQLPTSSPGGAATSDARPAAEWLRSAGEADRLRLFVEHAPLAMAMFDREVRYVAASRRWKENHRLVGELEGRSHYEIFPKMPERWREVHRRCLGGAIEQSDADAFTRADGSISWLKWEVRPWMNEAGAIGGIVIFSEDITQQKRIEEDLRSRERQLQLIADTAPVFIAHCDTEHRYKFVNERFAARFGLNAKDLPGQKIRDVVGEGVYAKIRPYIERALRGEMVEFELELPYEKLGDRVMHCAYAPERAADGSVVGLVAVLSDTTGRRGAELALRESEERFRSAFENAAVGVALVGLDGRWLRVNEMVCTITGYSREELLQKTFAEITHPDDLEFNLAQADRLLAGVFPTYSLEKRYVRPDGSPVWVNLTASLHRDTAGAPKNFITIIEDITRRKRAEQAMREAKESAEAAGRAKDDFFAALSHELRTPLTPVLLCATAAAVDPALPPGVREDFAMIRRNVELEARLIDDLLDLTRVSRGKLDLQRSCTDVHTLLRQTGEIVSGDLRARAIELRWQLDARAHHVLSDAARLQQVFWNLLKNAVKFTDPGGRVTVRTENPTPASLAISVEDTGRGIAAEALGRIFRPFDQGQLDEGRHQFGGLGLGLAIGKAIVDLHGGTLHAASDGLGRGATFTVSLEAAAPPAATTDATETEAVEPPARRRLLVVDDHPTTLETLTRVLRARGHTVHPASTMSQALALAAQHECDLVLSDLGLPDGSGLELMREIKRLYGWPGVALSGFGMESDLRDSTAAGFFAHLIKPVDLAQLSQVITAEVPGAR